MFDIAIKSSKTITPDGIKEAVIIIENGLIVDVTDKLPENHHDRVIDVKDKVLMPGIIDPHVHINEPGRTSWEGFDTATKAAVAGGVTTLVDMPLNSSPVTTTVVAFEKKLSSVKNQLHAHCGFWGGIVPGNENEIEGLIEKGVLGFKAFLVHSGIDEFPNITEKDLRKVMPVIAKHKLPLLVHCELIGNEKPRPTGSPGEAQTINLAGGQPVQKRSYQNYLSSRPKKWEDDAIALMIKLCEEYNCRVHVVHLSSSGSIDQIKKAKAKGLPLTVETAPHYLFFNAEDIKDGQTQFKCAPPIREKENNDHLWKALKDGVIDFIATDHSPVVPDLKELRSGDFLKAWGGIASLQFSLPALWTSAKNRDCSLEDIAKWLCENPSRLIGEEKNKGKIARGFEADLVIWDQQKSFTVTENIILHKNKTTPYLNEHLSGVVEQTYVRGIKIFDEGVFTELNKGTIILRKKSG